MDLTRRKSIKAVGLATAGLSIRGPDCSWATYPGDRGIFLSNQMPKVKVMGIGRVGCSMLDYILKKGIEHIEVVAMSMDPGFFEGKKFPATIILGEHLGNPPGLDGGPDLAEAYTAASVETIRSHLQGTDVGIILAGMGGVTGSGGAPVVARITRDLGIWTIGILTLPARVEGKWRLKTARNWLALFNSIADMTIVIPNSAISSNLPPGTPIINTYKNIFKQSDAIAYRAAKVFSDILLTPHLPAIDFVDIRRVFPRGLARIGVGTAHPKDGPEMAVRQAIYSPLLEGIALDKARSVVCNMNLSGAERNEEIHSAFQALQEECPKANMLTHTSMDEKVKTVATLIAGNFRELKGEFSVHNGGQITNFPSSDALLRSG